MDGRERPRRQRALTKLAHRELSSPDPISADTCTGYEQPTLIQLSSSSSPARPRSCIPASSRFQSSAQSSNYDEDYYEEPEAEEEYDDEDNEPPPTQPVFSRRRVSRSMTLHLPTRARFPAISTIRNHRITRANRQSQAAILAALSKSHTDARWYASVESEDSDLQSESDHDPGSYNDKEASLGDSDCDTSSLYEEPENASQVEDSDYYSSPVVRHRVKPALRQHTKRLPRPVHVRYAQSPPISISSSSTELSQSEALQPPIALRRERRPVCRQLVHTNYHSTPDASISSLADGSDASLSMRVAPAASRRSCSTSTGSSSNSNSSSNSSSSSSSSSSQSIFADTASELSDTSLAESVEMTVHRYSRPVQHHRNQGSRPSSRLSELTSTNSTSSASEVGTSSSSADELSAMPLPTASRLQDRPSRTTVRGVHHSPQRRTRVCVVIPASRKGPAGPTGTYEYWSSGSSVEQFLHHTSLRRRQLMRRPAEQPQRYYHEHHAQHEYQNHQRRAVRQQQQPVPQSHLQPRRQLRRSQPQRPRVFSSDESTDISDSASAPSPRSASPLPSPVRGRCRRPTRTLSAQTQLSRTQTAPIVGPSRLLARLRRPPSPSSPYVAGGHRLRKRQRTDANAYANAYADTDTTTDTDSDDDADVDIDPDADADADASPTSSISSSEESTSRGSWSAAVMMGRLRARPRSTRPSTMLDDVLDHLSDEDYEDPSTTRRRKRARTSALHYDSTSANSYGGGATGADTDNEPCPICYIDFTAVPVVLPCGNGKHRFCLDCFQEWRKSGVKDGSWLLCPICRAAHSSLAVNSALRVQKMRANEMSTTSRGRGGWGWH